MDGKARDAVNWLLSSTEPAVRLLARRDLLGEDVADVGEVLDGSMVRTLLSGQCRDGGFGVHPYRKWAGAHWRLVSLVELGIPPGEPRAVRAADTVLGWLTGREHRSSVVTIGGLVRCHASQEGNALAVCSRLGLGRDPRVKLLAESLMRWQWPDGGWNCDIRAQGRRSSFHESLTPAWGLSEYWQATGGPIRSQRNDHAQRAENTHDPDLHGESLQPDILSFIDAVPRTAAHSGHATAGIPTPGERDVEHARRTKHTTSRC